MDEDSSTLVATITLINASGTVPSTVLFSTADGTASAAASDYGAQSETIQLAGTLSNTTASTTQTVTITNDTGDPVREGNETFFIRLSNASIEGGGLAGSVVSGGSGGVVTTTVTIDDPQDAPTVAVADATVAEGGVAQVTVTLTGKTVLTTTVSYLSQVTSTGNALLQAVESGGQDYTAASGTLTFDPHPTTTVATLSIAVTTTQDTIDELNEIFAVDICGCLDLQKTGATGVSPLTSTDEIAIVTITDDDNAPSLAVANQKIVETAAGAATTTSATITVTLTGASSGGVTTTVVTAVSVAADATTTVTSSATAAKDYQTTSAVLTWAPDETGDKTFVVKVIDDAIEEDLETVVLVITNTTTATSTLGVTVSDNWGLLRIVDDEPAAKVVGITSDGEAMRGDWFFLVVAGADSDALGVSGIVSAAVSSTGNIVTGNVNPIAMVDDIVRGMHGLNTVRSKAATHAWLYMVPTSTQLGTLGFDFT